jgi:hypothetical protein
VRLALLILVDEDLLVHAVRGPLVAVGPIVVAQGGEGDHQGGEPLLAIDDEPALHAPGLDLPGSQDDRTEEVRRRAQPRQMLVDQLPDIRPEPLPLVAPPAVGALVQRHLELLLPLDQAVERYLLRTHRVSVLPSRRCNTAFVRSPASQ